jgi:hypothetical protein
MNKKRILGISLFLLGVVLIVVSTSPTPTGAAIGTGQYGNSLSLVGLVLIIGGMVVLMAKAQLENLAQEVLNSGRHVGKSKELKKISNKMGYSGKNVREGYQVRDEDGNVITVIPNHNEINSYVSKSVLKALATGESNYGKRTGYQSD